MNASLGPYLADAVANEFLHGRLDTISPMKLQKLVYYAHAWSLVILDRPLIADRIEAWPFGPVIPTLYSEFSTFGSKPIDRFAYELGNDGKLVVSRVPTTDKVSLALIDRIWNLLGGLSAVQLSNMSHSENEPWAKVEKRRPGLAIPDRLIKDCFQKILSGSPGSAYV